MIYGKLPVVFLGLLASEKKGSTNSIIASYILEHLEDMKDIGIQQFAEDCNVSTSSISRFCRDVALRLFRIKNDFESTNLQKGPEASQGCFQERKKSYTEMTQSAIQQVSDSLNEPDVIELVQDIINHEK